MLDKLSYESTRRTTYIITRTRTTKATKYKQGLEKKTGQSAALVFGGVLVRAGS